MRTGNPALSSKVFEIESTGTQTMTLNGTVVRCFFLLALCVGAAAFSWSQVIDPAGNTKDIATLYAMGGAIVGLILSLVIIFKPTTAPVLSPVYALAEGAFVGALSAVFESSFPGIVIQAVGCTFGTFACLLLAYASGVIKATENFKLGVVAATGGIGLVYLATMVLGFFNISIPYIHSAGAIGIGFSVFVVIIAAMNLVLDFDFIEGGCERGAPKYMEWYAAFGLLVTLVWLYVEILRLLAKLRSRD